MPLRRAEPAREPRATAVVRALPFEGDDAALVAAIAAGRPDATATFYDRHAARVHGLVFRLMGPDAELEDVVHDVFIRAFESIGRLRDPSALRTWLLGIAVHVVRIRFQRRRRQRWLRFMAPEEVPEVAHEIDTEAGEALREAYAILRDLDTDERIALIVHRVEGLPLHEAADATGMSLSTFRRRLARAETRFFARARSRPELESYLGEKPGKRREP